MRWSYLVWVAVAALILTAPMALAAEKGGEKGKAKGVHVFGELTKVVKDGEKVTGIEVSAKGKEKGAAAETKAIAVDSSTKVMIEKEPAAGAEKGKPKAEEGKLEDLKVGQRVMIRCTEDGAKAVEIMVALPGAHKHGGEKGGDK